MKVDMVNPFVAAAREVIKAELDSDAERGKVSLHLSDKTADEVTALVAVTGKVRGIVLYTMSTKTACAMVSQMVGQECDRLDDLGQSAIAELANMITGKAGVLLEEVNLPSEIAPPALIMGKDSTVSTVDMSRLVVPLHTAYGDLSIHLALEAAA
ncbi:MAG: chemotaxis protein CheX [Dehalococcoidia bacterium]